MKKIKLTKNQFAIVDNDDYEKWAVNWKNKYLGLEAKNKKLKEYVHHKPDCPHDKNSLFICTCGLNKALEE